jgi:hypothetical protein
LRLNVDGDGGPIKMERKHLGRISSIGVVVKGILGANAKEFCSIGSCMPGSGDFEITQRLALIMHGNFEGGSPFAKSIPVVRMTRYSQGSSTRSSRIVSRNHNKYLMIKTDIPP